MPSVEALADICIALKVSADTLLETRTKREQKNEGSRLNILAALTLRIRS